MKVFVTFFAKMLMANKTANCKIVRKDTACKSGVFAFKHFCFLKFSLNSFPTNPPTQTSY
ncbi:hypothetical protein NTHI1209_00174 [Haemophilus influenzae]|uniref:Uncharacterized protein n=1 Tax=Haemophilus influenzae TaxID=727 RepID=A0A158SUN0_HAEIF|nr:hypothetical protein NTHI1209_00174 [Haemophilus influenzae]